jgi:hypothetical protein
MLPTIFETCFSLPTEAGRDGTLNSARLAMRDSDSSNTKGRLPMCNVVLAKMIGSVSGTNHKNIKISLLRACTGICTIYQTRAVWQLLPVSLPRSLIGVPGSALLFGEMEKVAAWRLDGGETVRPESARENRVRGTGGSDPDDGCCGCKATHERSGQTKERKPYIPKVFLRGSSRS